MYKGSKLNKEVKPLPDPDDIEQFLLEADVFSRHSHMQRNLTEILCFARGREITFAYEETRKQSSLWDKLPVLQAECQQLLPWPSPLPDPGGNAGGRQPFKKEVHQPKFPVAEVSFSSTNLSWDK